MTVKMVVEKGLKMEVATRLKNKFKVNPDQLFYLSGLEAHALAIEIIYGNFKILTATMHIYT